MSEEELIGECLCDALSWYTIVSTEMCAAELCHMKTAIQILPKYIFLHLQTSMYNRTNAKVLAIRT